ncbi:hypothetical protein [Metabacillus dongyingensis]|uniref:hypothetical protein n=1 Tax=Metabacillus dongyingensis TaxID=2874282 RepID=UPI003BA175A9
MKQHVRIISRVRFFLPNVEEIKRIANLSLVDGITINPTLIAKEGMDFRQVKVICSVLKGSVSSEVIG